MIVRIFIGMIIFGNLMKKLTESEYHAKVLVRNMVFCVSDVKRRTVRIQDGVI